MDERIAKLEETAGGEDVNWADVQLQLLRELKRRRTAHLCATTLTEEDFERVLALPEAEREAAWRKLGGLYGRDETPTGSSAPAAAPVADAQTQVAPEPAALASLNAEQLRELWAEVQAPRPTAYDASPIAALGALLKEPGNRVNELELLSIGFCGLQGVGYNPLPGCQYAAEAIDYLCDALAHENCVLKTLRLGASYLREAEAGKLAAGIRHCHGRGPPMTTIDLDGLKLSVPSLLGPEEELNTDNTKLNVSQLRLVADLIGYNTSLTQLRMDKAQIGDKVMRLIPCFGTLPLKVLSLVANSISAQHGSELIQALPSQLEYLDLSDNPICGVDDNGKDEFTTECVEKLTRLERLEELKLARIALCGRSPGGNGSYETRAAEQLLHILQERPELQWKVLDVGGSGMKREEATRLSAAALTRGIKTLTLDGWTAPLGDDASSTLAVPSLREADGAVLCELLKARSGYTTLEVRGAASAAGLKLVCEGLEATPSRIAALNLGGLTHVDATSSARRRG